MLLQLEEFSLRNASTVFLACAGIAIVLLFVYAVCRRSRHLLAAIGEARHYAAAMQDPGHLPPPPTDDGQRWMMRLSRALCWLFVGKIEVTGSEHLQGLPTKSVIITPNHPSPYDVVVLPAVIDQKARYMAALGVMQALGGVGGLVVGPLGAFAANLDRGKGAPAFRAAIRVLTSGQSLVMWPEGWTYLDGKIGPFKKGAVRIAKQSAAELGEPTYIVPVSLTYGKYPGAKIMRLPIKLQYLLLVAGFPFFRRGVKVVIGKPIASNALPENDTEATELLKTTIVALGKH